MIWDFRAPKLVLIQQINTLDDECDFFGGDYVKYVKSRLMPNLLHYPTLRICSLGTILRDIKEQSNC